MKRPLFLALTVITALVAAVLPIAISMRMAEDEVTRREQERLEWYTNAGCCAGTCRLCSALFGDVLRRHMTAPSPGNALADTTLQTIRHLGRPGLPGAVLRQVPHAGACARGDQQENPARATWSSRGAQARCSLFDEPCLP
ncbi:hypothetical protein [Cupriavidus sp. TMH.W2]|uniref:hypothetical protein n=1 Tax=Cupriavidus sp. TMH.W2 TaxID=3434465 RepID=UPI003D789757